MFRKAQGENIVRCLNVAYDDFRKEIWVVSIGMVWSSVFTHSVLFFGFKGILKEPEMCITKINVMFYEFLFKQIQVIFSLA